VLLRRLSAYWLELRDSACNYTAFPVDIATLNEMHTYEGVVRLHFYFSSVPSRPALRHSYRIVSCPT